MLRQPLPTWFSHTALLLTALLLCFCRLDCSLLEPEETRYAEISRQMLVEGHWLVPTTHGQPYYDKPPLLYWLIMASYKVFGTHDWSARLVSSTALFLCVIVTYAWGRCVTGTRMGLFAALILCLSVEFIYRGRMVTMNGLVCLFIVTSLGLAHRALLVPDGRRKWWYLSAAACGAGILAKGPVALVLTMTPLLLLRCCDRDLPRPGWRLIAGFLLTALGISAAWFIAVAVVEPRFLYQFFWVHHVERFVVPFDHNQPFSYYVPWLLLGMFPWTLLLPGLMRCWHSDDGHAAEMRRAAKVFLLCAVTALVFFSLSGCKRKGYILPAMPPLALALACRLESLFLEAESAGTRHGFWRHPPCWVCSAGAVFVFAMCSLELILPRYARLHSLRDQVQPLADHTRESPVFCYPHHWDSVSFYLQRLDVEALGANAHERLQACLHSNDKALVFVKTEVLQAFVAELPATLEFVPVGERSWATAGWVRRR